MIRVISKINLVTYSKIAKPLLFKFSADSVHASMTRAGIIAQNVPGFCFISSKALAYNAPELRTTIAGIELANPVGLSAGFDKEARLPKLMQAFGYSMAEVGSITAQPYNGNKQPWYSRLPHSQSILVNSGLRSSGVAKVADKADKLYSKRLPSLHINASVARTNKSFSSVEESVNDYIASLRRLEKSNWHSMYTINISCPNTSAGESFSNPKNLQKLLEQIDKLKIKRPVFLKLPIDLDWAKTNKLIKVASKSNLQGLTIGNLAKDRSLVDPRDTLTPKQKGNLSGKPCFNASNELIKMTRKTYGDRFYIIGVGGVFTAEDAYAKIKLGADMIEMITGMIFRGPAAIGDINRGLTELLRADGYSSVSQAVGADAR